MRPRFHSAEVLPKFVGWSVDPTGTWLQLPRFFTGKLPAGASGGLWLQADGYCCRASWVSVEISVTGNVALARGWQMFARARGLGPRCTLHFKFDGDATLYVRVFGEDGCSVGCCPEDDDGDWVLSLGDSRDEDEGGPVPGGVRSSPRFGGSPSNDSSSSGDRDQPPRRQACFEGVVGHPAVAPR